jgi:bacterioferritin-associated ferredoxin
VDDAIKYVVAADVPTITELGGRLGHGEVKASMGSCLAVVAQVLAKHRLELTT